MSATTTNLQTLVCTNCEESWTRVPTRGRPPLYCDNCRRLGGPIRRQEAPKFQVQGTTTTRKAHYAFSTLLQVAAARVPAMLVGPAGSGKSTAGRMVAESFGLDFVTESCSPQMSKWDIMGFMGANG